MNGIAGSQAQQSVLQISPSSSSPSSVTLSSKSANNTPSLQHSPSNSSDTPSVTSPDTANSNTPKQVPDAAKTAKVQLESGVAGTTPAVECQGKVDEVKELASSAGTGLDEPASVKEEGVAAPSHVNGQIELLEHTPDQLAGTSDTVGAAGEEGHEYVPDSEHELKRVKVYELIGSRWVDQGTAFCFGHYQEETNEALLIARAERNYSDIILSTAIRSNDVYQRQQDTLIVWTEPDGVDYALSFQDPEGCSEVWNFILEVQRHMNNTDDSTNLSSSPHLDPEASHTTAGIIRSGHLPTPHLGIIGEIERAIKALARTQLVKERICEYIQQEDYIKSLIEVMNTAEDLESLENLHALCSIMQTILMLNDHGLYEHVLEDDVFFGVVGMLEYDPDFPGHKANYRQFLHQTSRFHQPILIRDPAIQRKIHHTYRLQFLKDVVLARALDDSTFNVLNSCVIFNQIDIITHVQQDHTFLRDIVRLFVDEDLLGAIPQKKPIQGQPISQPQHMVISLNGNGDNIGPAKPPEPAPMDVDQKPPSPKLLNGAVPPSPSTERPRRHESYGFAVPDDLTEEEINLRREVIILIQQLSVMGKNVQLPARMALFRSLVDRGILFAVQWALGLPEKEAINKPMISAAGEVLSSLLDHDLNGVRNHVAKQVVAIEKERDAGKKGADKAETLIEMTCRIMAQSRDLAVQSQIGDALKVWTDIPPVDAAPPTPAGEANAGNARLPQRKDEPGTERFVEYFYKSCINILLKPLLELTEWKDVKDPVLRLTREEINRFVYLCDLLHNFILQHSFRSHFYVLSSDIISRVASLLKAKDKHLRHSSFRIFRLLLKQNNQIMHSLMMKYDVLKPIIDLTLQESRRDNLLSCSCQEFFENMRRENMKEMIKFCMKRHEPEIRKLAQSVLGGQRFELLIRRFEMNNEPLPPMESKPEKPLDTRWPDQGRVLDAEEEDYFNADDDDDADQIISPISQQWLRVNGPTSPIRAGFKRRRRIVVGSGPKGHRPPLRNPSLSSLVDYDEDEEDLDGTDQSSQGTQNKPLLQSSPITNSSYKPPHRLVSTPPFSGPPPRRTQKDNDDDEDNLLEALVRPKTRSQSPAPNTNTMPPTRPIEKRRRSDDDDDELLERLSRSKKQDLGSQKETGGVTGGTARAKNGDDPPPKKMKVKFGAGGLTVAKTSPSPSTTPVPSEGSAKDGDTG